MNASTYTCKHILELRQIHAVPGLDKFKWLLNILHTFICYIYMTYFGVVNVTLCCLHLWNCAVSYENCEKNNVFPCTIGINVITKCVFFFCWTVMLSTNTKVIGSKLNVCNTINDTCLIVFKRICKRLFFYVFIFPAF